MSHSKQRQRIYDRMADEWGLKYNLKLPRLLADLCGRDDVWGRMVELTTEREIEVCNALLSANGYAYFRALCVKFGIDLEKYRA